MAKITMHKELEMLRKEVEDLKNQKIANNKIELKKDIEEQENEDKYISEVKDKAEEIITSLEDGKTEAKDALNQLMDTIKDDYENLSPTSAIVLFSLGAAFGHALSSK